jgi:hypothetical protein
MGNGTPDAVPTDRHAVFDLPEPRVLLQGRIGVRLSLRQETRL